MIKGSTISIFVIITIIVIVSIGLFFRTNRSNQARVYSTIINNRTTIPTSQASPNVTSLTTAQQTTTISQASTNITSSYQIPLNTYIMAFLAYNTTIPCNGPSCHVTYLAESNNGTVWIPLPGFKPYGGTPQLLASVPDVLRRGNVLYIYNPGGLTRYHLDSGVQESERQVVLKSANGTFYGPGFVDPSLIKDKNGSFVLFYLPGMFGHDPAQCSSGQQSCVKQIMSATEVSGSDGSVFIIDTGARANIQINGSASASDPAIFKGPGGYYLYVSEGQSTVAFFSSTLRGNYTYVRGLQNGVLVQQGVGGVPAGYYDNLTGTFWTFVTSIVPRGSSYQKSQVIRLAKTNNINNSISNSSFVTIISGCTFPGLGCLYDTASPGVHLGNG